VVILPKSLNAEYAKYSANEKIDIGAGRIVLEVNGA